MKLLRISVSGLALFKENLDIDFFAEQRVDSENAEMLFHAFNRVYTNNSIAIVGINASGKTSVLKVISFIINMLNNEPINNIRNKDILKNSDTIQITSYFCNDDFVYKLYTVIKKDMNDIFDEGNYKISKEVLFRKKTLMCKTKKDLFLFDDTQLHYERSSKEEFLKDDISIVILLNKMQKKKNFYLRDLINYTNMNFLNFKANFPHELIQFLDPSIEYINFSKSNSEICIKFFNRDEIKLSNPLELESYLSSGTIKGLNVFINAMLVFNEGGYLIIDEIENHFNREIVATLIRFFMNSTVNKNGATIIFSTHYSELLDEFDRNDGIYVVRNQSSIELQKLTRILKRNDIKKSEAFQSDFLEGTVPLYESYLQFKKAIIRSQVREG